MLAQIQKRTFIAYASFHEYCFIENKVLRVVLFVTLVQTTFDPILAENKIESKVIAKITNSI